MDDQFLKEIDGVLYLTVTFRGKIGIEYPVVLKFDYDAETFEFCVAGDYDTAMIPIPIVK